jgi:hypothetical protein
VRESFEDYYKLIQVVTVNIGALLSREREIATGRSCIL